jgi:uncharacterized protein (TIGR02922 family)
MTERKTKTVTIIYYCDNSLELLHEVAQFEQNTAGRVIIPSAFKDEKSIIAVCEGEIVILNKFGDRIMTIGEEV